jgi:hypothetical protein
MIGRFAANVRAGLAAVRKHPAIQVGCLALIVSSVLVGESGVRFLIAIGCLGVLFAGVGAYLGVDLEAETREEARETGPET